MLFHWAWSIEELTAYDSLKIQLAVSEIIRASRKGYHLISLSRKTATWIAENVDLSNADKSQVSSIGANYTQTGGLSQVAALYVEISSMNNDFELLDNKLKVSQSYIIKSNLLEPARLIVENIDNDGWLFELILRNYTKTIGIARVNFELQHGGGHDVVRVLARNIEEKRIALLLTDSDKLFPSDRVSDTIKQGLRICANGNMPHCTIKVLPCHEIENLLPTELVSLLQSAAGHGTIGILQQIESLEKASGCPPHDRYWMYFDVKLGLSQDRLNSMHRDGQAWHKAKLEMIGMPIEDLAIEGFGKQVIPTMKSDGSLVSLFASKMREKKWLEIFSESFAYAGWFFISEKPSIT